MAYDEELAQRIREALAGEPGVTERKMFGGLGFMVHGHMAVAAGSKGALMVRIDPARADELTADPHAHRMVMRGREMDGWLEVDTEGLRTDEDLTRWLQPGLDFVRDLPPK